LDPLFVVFITVGGLGIARGETAAPPNASVYIISPKDGDTVTNPLKVQFGLSGMGIAPAGVDKPSTGHHHLLIDVDEPLDPNEPIPRTRLIFISCWPKLRRFVELPPGRHTLQLVLGTGRIFHSIRPSCQDVITVNVKMIRPNRRPLFCCCGS